MRFCVSVADSIWLDSVRFNVLLWSFYQTIRNLEIQHAPQVALAYSVFKYWMYQGSPTFCLCDYFTTRMCLFSLENSESQYIWGPTACRRPFHHRCVSVCDWVNERPIVKHFKVEKGSPFTIIILSCSCSTKRSTVQMYDWCDYDLANKVTIK